MFNTQLGYGSFEFLCRVVVKCPDVSEERAASIFRVTEFFWLDQLSIQPN